ncbi:hypothetical protein NP233_g10623 [Leucocoprinus birnbaumii]|uniref:Uncharacterized protein n=1 Tax=Leucocoprinus birnbaumii TaxID=56174 RepID=A0AAD5VHY6_9AGAR|nr:hypothetical protein NP233_g10623 [Leucocoprinus birnbaumii]
MLIALLIAAALNSVIGAPVSPPTEALNPSPLTVLGRDIPLPECIDPAAFRTMQQIVLSCLATVIACTWVSLHPNVPDPRNSSWQNFTMRLRTVLWAILGPEFVTIWAFRQRLGAARTAKEYNEQFDLNPPSRSIIQYLLDWFRRPYEGMKPDKSWGLTHGFLLEMHGLRYFKNGQPFTPSPSKLHTHDLENEALDNTPDGIITHLSQLSKPVHISKDEINDKSNGDFFTKFIVVVQTTWFIVQCIARWVQGLHVTELEIITLAFAALNIMTYILWWNKPQHMRVAITLHHECISELEMAGDH